MEIHIARTLASEDQREEYNESETTFVRVFDTSNENRPRSNGRMLLCVVCYIYAISLHRKYFSISPKKYGILIRGTITLVSKENGTFAIRAK